MEVEIFHGGLTLSVPRLRLGSWSTRWHDVVVEQTERPVRRRRRPDRQLLIVSGIVAIGLMFVARGVLVGVTGDARVPLPSTIESVSPVPDAEQALAQSDVVVDLPTGYTGVLIVDGIEIETVDLSELQSQPVEPGAQVSIPPVTVFEPGNHTLTYSPSANGPVDRFDSGLHRVEVVYWLIEDGPSRTRSFTWQFNVI